MVFNFISKYYIQLIYGNAALSLQRPLKLLKVAYFTN